MRLCYFEILHTTQIILVRIYFYILNLDKHCCNYRGGVDSNYQGGDDKDIHEQIKRDD